jgi:hypothetical protein
MVEEVRKYFSVANTVDKLAVVLLCIVVVAVVKVVVSVVLEDRDKAIEMHYDVR